MDQKKRPSIYLQERCAELGRVLEFFMECQQHSQLPSLKERLVVFLAQIGFWEWEIDNLIYAFTTFSERAQAWQSQSGMALIEELKSHGILVQNSGLKNLRTKRQARNERTRQVVAPTEDLNRLIVLWNTLLDVCEEKALLPIKERRDLLNVGFLAKEDLSSFRKQLLPETLEKK